MEAFALGRPVISTYIAGIPELVRPGENGWLIPSGNVQALADAMRKVLVCPAEQLDALGNAGRQRTVQLHYTPTEVDRLERLFLVSGRTYGEEDSGGGFRRGSLGSTPASAARV